MGFRKLQCWVTTDLNAHLLDESNQVTLQLPGVAAVGILSVLLDREACNPL